MTVTVQAVISRGAFTEIRAARYDGNRVFVKLAREDRAEAGPRLEDETRVLTTLSHANFVRALGRIEWSERTGLVIADAGWTLSALAGDRPAVPEHVIAAITVQLADGLEAIAAAQIVHRDLAPQNIYLDLAGHLRIGDFGSAHHAGRSAQTRAGQVVGTEGFMAPEQRAGGAVDARADRYAAARVLEWLRGGNEPWAGPLGEWVRWATLDAVADRPRDLRGLRAAAREVLEGAPSMEILRAWIATVERPPEDPGAAEAQVALRPLVPVAAATSTDKPAFDMFLGVAEPPPARQTEIVAPHREEVTQIDAVVLAAEVDVGAEVFGYRLTEVLGRGQWGRVFLGRHEILGREAAVKVLHDAFAQEPVAVERFFREAKVLATLDHPNVVRVETCGRAADGAPFMIMERVAGPSLDAVLTARKTLPAQEAAVYLREIAVGLQAAHDSGLVHRDLKPANILLTGAQQSPRLKIVDFGIAHLCRSENPLTRTHEFIGTPGYSSPEQIQQSRSVDARSDLYALGVMAYLMLAGRRPFFGKPLAVVRSHVYDAVPPLPSKSVLDDLVYALLEKDRERRPASASEVVAHIDRIFGPLAGGADPVETAPTAVRPPPVNAEPRSPWSMIAAGGLVGTAVAAGLLLYGATRSEPKMAEPVDGRDEVVVVQPRVVAAPTEAAPPSPAPASPPPVERRSRRARRAPIDRAPGDDVPDALGVDALARRAGLPPADLRRVAERELAVYAERPSDAALRAVEAAASDQRRLDDVVRDRLRDVKARLAARAAALPPDRARELESKLLDLQERSVEAKTAEDRRAILSALRKLRGSIEDDG